MSTVELKYVVELSNYECILLHEYISLIFSTGKLHN